MLHKKVVKVVGLLYQPLLLVDDTHAYIFTDFEGGNANSAPGVGGNLFLLAVDLDP